MQRPTVGSVVKSVDDRVVGVIREVNWCCVTFDCRDGSPPATARWEGVFDIQHQVVTLIYAAGEPHRYECRLHSAQPPAPIPALPRVVRVDRDLNVLRNSSRTSTG